MDVIGGLVDSPSKTSLNHRCEQHFHAFPHFRAVPPKPRTLEKNMKNSATSSAYLLMC
jgi:hypothetical protein